MWVFIKPALSAIIVFGIEPVALWHTRNSGHHNPLLPYRCHTCSTHGCTRQRQHMVRAQLSRWWRRWEKTHIDIDKDTTCIESRPSLVQKDCCKGKRLLSNRAMYIGALSVYMCSRSATLQLTPLYPGHDLYCRIVWSALEPSLSYLVLVSATTVVAAPTGRQVCRLCFSTWTCSGTTARLFAPRQSRSANPNPSRLFDE